MAFLKRNILVVDGHEPSRKGLITVLRQAGYTCTIASDPFEAVEFLFKYAFDLVITELTLQHKTGRDFLKQLKTSDKTKSLPVVVYTDRGDKDLVQTCMALGAADYWLKSAEKTTFLGKIERILGGRPRFAEVPMPEDDGAYSEVVFKTHLVSIGETGLVIWSPIPLDEDSVHRIRAKVFALIGINSPELKVASCQAVANGYNVYFTFIGMKDQDMQNVRTWVIDKNLSC